MPNYPARGTEIDCFPLLNVSTMTCFGIDAFGDGYPSCADMRQKADRTQQPRGVVDQMEKRSKRENAEQHRQQHHQLVGLLVHEVLCAEREHQCEYEEPDGVFDDAIAQQRRCDQPRLDKSAVVVSVGPLSSGHGGCFWHAEAHRRFRWLLDQRRDAFNSEYSRPVTYRRSGADRHRLSLHFRPTRSSKSSSATTCQNCRQSTAFTFSDPRGMGAALRRHQRNWIGLTSVRSRRICRLCRRGCSIGANCLLSEIRDV